VAEGDADLGWAGTRVFDTVGVPAFQPLHAPFLVGSYDAQATVVRDDVADEMLGSLEPLGLTGLGIVADQLRMPAAVAEPLLTPEDFSGLVMRTASSLIQVEALRALRADPTTQGHPADREGVDGVETMWWTYEANHQYDYAPFITRNAVLWPRTVALFANSETLDGLDEDLRGWIDEAADEAVVWSTEHAADEEAGQIEAACRGGARVATATDDQLADLRAAVEPVYRSLRADETLGDTLDRIEALVADVARPDLSPLPSGCAYSPGDEVGVPAQPTAEPGAGESGSLPEGVYRYAVSVGELRDAGFSRNDAEFNAGVYTWTLADGEWSHELEPEVPDAVEFTTCGGTYDVRDQTVTFTTTTEVAGGDCAPPSWIARFSVDGDSLVWTVQSFPGFDLLFAPAPWQRIS
jgi:TRAP-type C4-dicarboxylate transport system substrate-binding protein